jgi:hypothetical protein
MSSRDVDSALERRPQLAEVHPLDSGQHDRVAQHPLAASERDPSFGAERSGHLDYIGACSVLALTSQGERARAGGEDKCGDDHDRLGHAVRPRAGL